MRPHVPRIVTELFIDRVRLGRTGHDGDDVIPTHEKHSECRRKFRRKISSGTPTQSITSVNSLRSELVGGSVVFLGPVIIKRVMSSALFKLIHPLLSNL